MAIAVQETRIYNGQLRVNLTQGEFLDALEFTDETFLKGRDTGEIIDIGTIDDDGRAQRTIIGPKTVMIEIFPNVPPEKTTDVVRVDMSQEEFEGRLGTPETIGLYHQASKGGVLEDIGSIDGRRVTRTIVGPKALIFEIFSYEVK